MPNITITLWPSKVQEDGSSPIYAVCRHEDKRAVYSLGISVPEKHWNENTGEVRRTYGAKHRDLNKYLAKVRAEAQSVIIDASMSREIVTAVRLRNELRRRLENRPQGAPQDFLSYARGLISGIEREGRIATARGYSVAVGKLESYAHRKLGEKYLPLSEITPDLIRGFRTYCIEVHKNTVNTANKNIRIIRTLYYQAMKDGLVSQESNPFFTVRLKDEKVQKDFVTYDEIRSIEQLDLRPHSLIWHVRNYFLFAFYAGGMRWSDVALLKWKHVQGGRTRYKMRKTKEGAGVPLLPQAREILGRYEETGPDDFVFPILKGADLSTAAKEHAAIASGNTVANKYLKKIAKRAKIDTPLSTHLARHSIAWHLKKQGWDVYRIREILGHESIDTTEKYLAGFETGELDQDYRDAF